MSSNIYINPETPYYKGIFAESDALSIVSGDKRYTRIGSDAGLRSLTLSNSLFTGGSISTNTITCTNITSSGSIDATGFIESDNSIRCTRTTNGSTFLSINGTSTCSLFHFNNSDVFFGTTTNNSLFLQTAGTGRIGIDAATGNVGIPTINSSYRLNVSGDVNITGSYLQNGTPLTGFSGIITPTTRVVGGITVAGMVYNVSADRLYGQRQIDTNNYSLFSYSAGGTYNDYLTWQHGATPTLTLTSTAALAATTVNITTANITTINSPLLRLTPNMNAGTDTVLLRWGAGNETFSQWGIKVWRNAALNGNSHFALFNEGNAPSGDTGNGSHGIVFGSNAPPGAAGGCMIVMNGTNGNGYIKTDTTAPQGLLHINGGITRTVPSGWAYTSSGDTPATSASVAVSLYTYQNIHCRGVLYCSSDRRLKNVIRSIDSSKASNLLKLTPKWYKWKSDSDTSNAAQLGLIAQDLLDCDLKELTMLMPNADMSDEDKDHNIPKGHQLSIAYDRLSLYLLELVKMQQVQLENIQETISKLTSRPVVAKWMSKTQTKEESGDSTKVISKNT
jgi:hypothetical protein